MDVIVKYLPTILVGLAAIIPLVAALIKYVTKAADSKNWNIIVKMVLDLMVQAEQDSPLILKLIWTRYPILSTHCATWRMR